MITNAHRIIGKKSIIYEPHTLFILIHCWLRCFGMHVNLTLHKANDVRGFFTNNNRSIVSTGCKTKLQLHGAYIRPSKFLFEKKNHKHTSNRRCPIKTVKTIGISCCTRNGGCLNRACGHTQRHTISL